MKALVLTMITLASLGAQASMGIFEGQLPKEREVVVSLSDAYIPGGFDSETDAYVVANGLFPNGCYKWKGAQVKSVGLVHEVKSTAAVSQGMCIMVLVPFTKEIHLGKLEVGKHTIRFVNGDGTYMEKTMLIEE